MMRDHRELNWQQFQHHQFLTPSADLAPYVARYWIAEWHYARPYRQLIVPYPNVHLSFGVGGAEVHGVASGHVFKDLHGRGQVFGVAFHPGCFRPFLGRPVRSITDRAVPGSQIFRGSPHRATINEIETMLRANLPTPDPMSELATDLVARITAEPTIIRVDDLAEQVGTTVRQLQRLFAEHVGVGPKWVIRRYRLHEVTERMAAGADTDWAALAAELGYADQAHFVRDFSKMFGESPTKYAARY